MAELFRHGFNRMPDPDKLPAPPSPADMQALVSRAGLALNPGQMADLVLAWRQVAALLADIPRARPLADDQAYVFRLPPPTPSARAEVTKATEAAPRKRRPAKPQPVAKRQRAPVPPRKRPRKSR